MYQDLHVIDFHCHFPTEKPWFGGMGPDWRKDYVERVGERRAKIAREQAIAYNKEWRLAWDFPPPEKEHPGDEVQAQRWAEEMDRYGLRAVGFVTGGGNDNLAEIIGPYSDKFIGFAHHYLFAENAVEELYRAVNELGFKGYKLLAPALDRPIEDPAAYPVWEACADLNIPVLIHFGILGSGGGIATHENINPLKLHNVAKDFPDVNFVVPHFGCAWVREALQLCWACRNVYIDTSGSNQWIRWVPGDLTVKELFRKYLSTIGAERLIFGSDSSWFPRGFAVRYLQDQIRDARDLGMSHDQLQAIFGGNAARLFKIELAD
ncbi:MAG: amidohydrolase family protein [Ardenticatenaceae bacterium]|nr:amidohydrolase family protein [Ardenticatenaceae bacterium]